MPIDVSGVGFGQNEGFTYQARAFLEEVAEIPEEESLPRNASFDEGVHNMEILAAVARSAADNGKQVNLRNSVSTTRFCTTAHWRMRSR